MPTSLQFEIEAVCPWSGARAGVVTTPHGQFETPIFMPVATNSTMKSLTFEQLKSCKAEIVLSNSYHLYLRPGHQLIEEAGGLHNFMGWDRPILTDSGGFQVFSLASLRQIGEQGVTFKDHRNGREHFIGPSESMSIQNAIGADIIMAFDDCVKNPASHEQARQAMERTHRWLDKCLTSHSRKDNQALFGIVQGSIYKDLRKISADEICRQDLPGCAIGGVAVGEERSKIEEIVQFTTPLLPEKKPRYLMGIGTPWDICYAIRCGIDMFDCVSPTRLARHGAAFTDAGRISLKNSPFSKDFTPLEANCPCYTCTNHNRAYLHHLVRSKEVSGGSLLSIHNVSYLIEQARKCRQAILQGTFKEYFDDIANTHEHDTLINS